MHHEIMGRISGRYAHTPEIFEAGKSPFFMGDTSSTGCFFSQSCLFSGEYHQFGDVKPYRIGGFLIWDPTVKIKCLLVVTVSLGGGHLNE